MGFSSSIQTYLDPPNWQHLHSSTNNYQTGPGTNDIELVNPPSQPFLPPQQQYGGAGSIRPGSMTDRARQANIPIPEAAVKCPRCESTNTKFCYFNNYSLTQPRHFCKTCRRYWTRGGALRNVPVGGGYRRNKRTKNTTATASTTTTSSHKSQDSISNNTVMTVGQASTSGPNYSGFNFNHESILSQVLQPMRLMAPPNIQNQLNELINITNYNNMGGFSHSGEQESVLASVEQRRCQNQIQSPELALLGGYVNNVDYYNPSLISSSSSMAARLTLVNGGEEDISSFKWDCGGSSATNWTDVSNFSSSSAGKP